MSSVQLSVVSDSASSISKTAKAAGILRPKVPGTNVISLAIPEVLVIEPKILGDQRGFFFEAFQAERYASYGITQPFVQDNISRSANGVLRGLHLQNPKCQGKLLTVLRGTVLDVAVDVRLGSPTFGRHVSAELSEENRRQIWIPRASRTVSSFYPNRRTSSTNAITYIAPPTRSRCAGTMQRSASSGA